MKFLVATYGLLCIFTLLTIGQSDWSFTNAFGPLFLFWSFWLSTFWLCYKLVKRKNTVIILGVLISIFLGYWSYNLAPILKHDWFHLGQRKIWHIDNYKIVGAYPFLEKPPKKIEGYTIYKYKLCKTIIKRIEHNLPLDTLKPCEVKFYISQITFNPCTEKLN